MFVSPFTSVLWSFCCFIQKAIVFCKTQHESIMEWLIRSMCHRHKQIFKIFSYRTLWVESDLSGDDAMHVKLTHLNGNSLFPKKLHHPWSSITHNHMYLPSVSTELFPAWFINIHCFCWDFFCVDYPFVRTTIDREYPKVMITSSLSEEGHIHNTYCTEWEEKLIWLHEYFFPQCHLSFLCFIFVYRHLFVYRHQVGVESNGANTHMYSKLTCI